MNRTSYRKLKTSGRGNFSPKVFDPYKPKMFSHKNLHHETQKIKTHSTDRISTLPQEDLKKGKIKARKVEKF
jgi:hypothetical protein